MKLSPPMRQRGRPMSPFAPVRQLLLFVLVFLSLFPIYFILVNAVKNRLQYAQDPWFFPAEPQWSNYARAWSKLGEPIINSSIIVIISVAGILLCSALAAFAFAHIAFPGKNALFMLVFVLLLIPGFLTLIPLYLQIKKLNLGQTYWAVILPYIAGGQAFSIFVLRTFFGGLSKELIEAAKIDGAGDMRVFRSVALPLSMPVLTSVGIINLVPIWNDYLLPQLVLDKAHRTVTMALVAFQGSAQSHTAPDFGALMASYALSSIPLLILFSFLMRYYIEGLTAGSVKM
jgi:ABC-type glycerol-3-phosphate transport system permease component